VSLVAIQLYQRIHSSWWQEGLKPTLPCELVHLLLENETDSPGTLASSRLIFLQTNQFTNILMFSVVQTVPSRPLPVFLMIVVPVRSARLQIALTVLRLHFFFGYIATIVR